MLKGLPKCRCSTCTFQSISKRVVCDRAEEAARLLLEEEEREHAQRVAAAARAKAAAAHTSKKKRRGWVRVPAAASPSCVLTQSTSRCVAELRRDCIGETARQPVPRQGTAWRHNTRRPRTTTSMGAGDITCAHTRRGLRPTNARERRNERARIAATAASVDTVDSLIIERIYTRGR